MIVGTRFEDFLLFHFLIFSAASRKTSGPAVGGLTDREPKVWTTALGPKSLGLIMPARLSQPIANAAISAATPRNLALIVRPHPRSGGAFNSTVRLIRGDR